MTAVINNFYIFNTIKTQLSQSTTPTIIIQKTMNNQHQPEMGNNSMTNIFFEITTKRKVNGCFI